MRFSKRAIAAVFTVLGVGAGLASTNQSVRHFVESLNNTPQEAAHNFCVWVHQGKCFGDDGIFHGRHLYIPPLSSRSAWIDVACYEGSKNIMAIVTGPQELEKNPTTLAGMIPVVH